MELSWKKSSYSDNLGGNCVELAQLGEDVGIRDSQDPDGPRILLAPVAFRALLADLKQR
ncbi:hypothetical protein GCM10023088_47420 [Actinomadura verrucosospora]|uniref:DUF397 domain-containing protein n=1 Tax=Actinomadura verrucosospora TaxID=46165 RepID=UPI0031EDD728